MNFVCQERSEHSLSTEGISPKIRLFSAKSDQIECRIVSDRALKGLAEVPRGSYSVWPDLRQHFQAVRKRREQSLSSPCQARCGVPMTSFWVEITADFAVRFIPVYVPLRSPASSLPSPVASSATTSAAWS